MCKGPDVNVQIDQIGKHLETNLVGYHATHDVEALRFVEHNRVVVPPSNETIES
jgi:hypothetical protein